MNAVRCMLVASALLTGGALSLVQAQAGVPDSATVVDRVVAVVGGRPILASQIEETMLTRAQGRPLPTDPTQLRNLRREVLEGLIDDELMVLEAERDTTIKVTNEEIQASVEQTFRNTRERYPNDVAFRQDLRTSGFNTPEEYRAWLVDEQRRALLIQALEGIRTQEGKIKTVTPTEAEMRALYEREKAGLQPRPPLVSFRQILIAPRATDDARAVTRALGDSIAGELRRGGDFATAARRFSQDPISREQGGSLDWFRRGQMVTEFERVAFGYRPGFISDAVESPFGFHIIQVERVQPAEVKARHILLYPTIDQPQADSARALAVRVLAAVRAGASIDSLQRLHHDRSVPELSSQIPETSLPEPYQAPVAALTAAGQVADLIEVSDPSSPTRTKFAIVQLTSRSPGGEPRYEDVVNDLRRVLSRRIGVRRYIDQLRRATHIEVRDP